MPADVTWWTFGHENKSQLLGKHYSDLLIPCLSLGLAFGDVTHCTLSLGSRLSNLSVEECIQGLMLMLNVIQHS